jgi:hypothetical protein
LLGGRSAYARRRVHDKGSLMDAIFTIATKSYLPQARTLGDSIRAIHPDLEFRVFLADESEGLIGLAGEKHPLIEIKDIGVPAYLDMAFKYDLVEFCTAIKPFVFEYLFDRCGRQRVLYFDPDIYVYSDLRVILERLNDHFVVLTPHLTALDRTDSGTKPYDDFLRCGVFNLGFIGLNGSPKGRSLLSWWKARTQVAGYADFGDGLYVDQKWADFFPCVDDHGVCIARHPGLNVAHWNMHQRTLSKDHKEYRVDGQPLVFFHYSGFDPREPKEITRPHVTGPVTLDGRPEYQELFEDYRARLLGNRTDAGSGSYAYARFENGAHIYGFQRRLYRRLTEEGFVFENPFAVTPGSYYGLLRTNRLLIGEKEPKGEFRKIDVRNAEGKLRMLKKGMLLLKKVIGIRNYHLLLRTLKDLSRPEEQTFLFETLNLDLPTRFR